MDILASTLVDVARGGDFGDAFKRNLISSLVTSGIMDGGGSFFKWLKGGRNLDVNIRSVDTRISSDLAPSSNNVVEYTRERANELRWGYIQNPDPENGGRVIAGLYDRTNDRLIYGISGEINSIDEVAPSLRNRIDFDSLEGGRPSFSCAEVSVCNRAINEGLDLENSVIVSILVESISGRIEPPCLNCSEWVYDVVGTVIDNR